MSGIVWTENVQDDDAFIRRQRGLSQRTPTSEKSEKRAKKMLTSSQLSDLFRRLDRNGNGVLEAAEFADIISKLKMDVSEDFVKR